MSDGQGDLKTNPQVFVDIYFKKPINITSQIQGPLYWLDKLGDNSQQFSADDQNKNK